MNESSLKKWMNAGFTVLPNLLLQHFKKLNLSHDELLLIIQIKSFLDQGNDFPDSQQLSKQLHLSQEEVFQLIHQLIQKKVIQIEVIKNEQGKTRDSYSLDYLWEKLATIENQEEEKHLQKEEEKSKQGLLKMFEQEFSRPLSPIEIQTIGMWIEEDKYPISLIELALKEAVLNQVYSLKYIDRILLTWQKKNIRTKEQAEKESSLYRERKNFSYTSENDSEDEPIP